MNIFGIDFSISDLCLLGIAGAVVIFLIVNRLVTARNNRET
jgi:hypothetical protein